MMKKRMFVLAMALTLALALVANAQGPSNWTEYAENPIINPPGGTECYYPSVLYDASGFGGHGESNAYKLWCDKYFQYYLSDDGIAWTFVGDQKDGTITGLPYGKVRHTNVEYYPNGFPGQEPGDPTMYYRGWYWYTGAPGGLYTIAAIRYAESPDGKAWYNDQGITQDSSSLVITPFMSHARGSYGPIDVLYNPGASNAGIDPFDWTFAIYYDQTPGAGQSIGLAYSADGKHWLGYDGNNDGLPDQLIGGLGSGGDNDWDRDYVTEGTVLRDDSGFHLWYSGGRVDEHPYAAKGVGYAFSPDGINWTKDPDNPILSRDDTGYPGEPWRSGKKTYTPMVVNVGGCLHMWFSGESNVSPYDADGSVIGYAYAPCVKIVEIDIKPGSDPNSINLGSKGVVPVAVLTTDDFDASTVDPGTVKFAGAQPVRWAMEDVDGDGDLDLLFHFKTQELNLTEYSIEATLTGETLGGVQIEGTDTVNIVPKGK
jgi:hypothetical protein